jgi:predicted TIM-barrel fold metal-dependent hydrolase
MKRRTFLRGAAAAPLVGLGSKARGAPPPVVVDVHCHNFCAADLPISGFAAHYIPGLTDLSAELTNVPERVFRALVGAVQKTLNVIAPAAKAELAEVQAAGATHPAPVADTPLADQIADEVSATTAGLASLVGAKVDVQAVVRRAAQVVFMLSHARARVTATLVDAYPEVGLFTPLLVDYDSWSQDRASSPLGDQIDVQAAIARSTVLGPMGPSAARVHPFVAFDPARPDALALLKHAVEERAFIGVKVYPPVGFAPLRNTCLRTDNMERSKRVDAALEALYDYCTQADVPITTHCAPSNEYGLGYRDLVAPLRWEPVLKKWKTLRLNLGHFGHTEGLDSLRGIRACEAWIRQAVALMDQYENVYADLSGSSLNDDPAPAAAYAKILDEVLDAHPRVAKRLMYGSDWWLARLFPGAPTYLTTFKAALKPLAQGRTDLMADVMGRNALRFLGFAGQGTGSTGAPTRNAARLAQLYDESQTPHPDWL